jgi:hypothetical protein
MAALSRFIGKARNASVTMRPQFWLHGSCVGSFQRSGYLHLFAFVLLRFVLVIQEVSG